MRTQVKPKVPLRVALLVFNQTLARGTRKTALEGQFGKRFSISPNQFCDGQHLIAAVDIRGRESRPRTR